METIKKKDFIELKFTGYSNGSIFDSNIEEDLKKLDSKAIPKETIVIVGEGMVVPGLDSALEGKETGKDYEIDVPAKQGFGERRKELMKTIPLKVFTEKKIAPYPGMVLAMDETLARVVTVSGARVITDFNNPLAGKDLKYKFKIVRKIESEKEKARAFLEFGFRFVPEFDVNEKEIVVKGPKIFERFIDAMKAKCKELCGKELKFELSEKKESEEKKS